jgi:hypothetical protein
VVAAFGLLALASVVSACDRTSSAVPIDSGTPVIVSPPSAELPPFPPAKSGRSRESGRKLLAKLVKRMGERQAVFAITNDTGQPVAQVREWHYHYDATGCIERERGACDVDLAPGATRECEIDLGDPRKLSRPSKTLEYEFFEADSKAGDVVWQNDNLVPPCDDRPLGGVPKETLERETGERVVAVYSGSSRVRSLFYVKNVSEGVTDTLSVAVFYYDKSGKLLRLYETFPRKLTLGPGKVGEMDVGFERIEMPVGTETQELTVWRVRYVDGTEWQNLNLKSQARPVGG